MADYDWATSIRRDLLQAEACIRAYNGGYVADLPHPFTISTGSSRCEICDGHWDRLIHQKPWQRPIYKPCPNCAGLGRIECDVCAETRVTAERIGVEEFGPVPRSLARRLRRASGRKYKRRKFRSSRPREPRSVTKNHIRALDNPPSDS